MEYLFDYLLFSAKVLTVVALVALPFLVALALRQGRGPADEPDLEVRRVNDTLRNAALSIEAAVLPPKAFKARVKAVRKEAKERAAGGETVARTFVIDFNGDLRASAVSELREAVTAVLAVAKDQDQVVVVLESGGGTIHGYGLAASQLRRIRERGIHLVCVVDRIAASGGYMMACVGNEIVAAPFAIIGSIGVVAQMPNFHRLLKKHDIDFEQITAGEFKRTLTLFGENTDAGREKFQQEIDDAHALFKDFIAECRPQLDLEQVGTGEYWFARRALELGLVDRLATSDDVLVSAADAGDVFRVRAAHKRNWLERLTQPLGALLRPPL